jgi:ATP-dependent DNA helicase RecQ
VIHLSLPKSIEQYYQEAGRAGRDSLPADCLLLWQKKDVGLLTYFINQLTDGAEKERSWQRYHTVRAFVESQKCRHLQICAHFGEKSKFESCDACDICGKTPAWLDEPVEVKRGRTRAAKAGASGSAGSRPSATTAGSSGPGYVGAPQLAIPRDSDYELRAYLREWRRLTAREQGIAAFLVMHDTSLDDMCRVKPSSLTELRNVSGFGERKTELYGQQILEALADFRGGARAEEIGVRTSAPAEQTRKLLEEGRTLPEIAEIRGRQLTSVVTLVADMVERGELEFCPGWVAEANLAKIEEVCNQLGIKQLKPIKEALPDDITYDEIKLVVAHFRSQSPNASPAKQAVQAAKKGRLNTVFSVGK